MATLQELMAECLGETAQGQEKTASATKTSTAEIDQVLENLGLQGSEAVEKTASAAADSKTNGGNMSLSDIYEQIMGGIDSEATQVKVASEGEQTQAEGGDEQSTAFGELVAEYFNEATEPYYEKVAADLETEAGKGEQPLAHSQTGGAMTAALGKPADPALPVNHSASGGAKLQVTTGNQSPYSLKEQALKKAILKRMQAAPVGNIVD